MIRSFGWMYDSTRPELACSRYSFPEVGTQGSGKYVEDASANRPLQGVRPQEGDARLWRLAQVPALSQKFRVVIFDQRDVGRSSKAAASQTIADIANDVAALMGALDMKRAHLLGLWMGGMIAQEFALRHAGGLQNSVLSSCGDARVAFDPIRTWSRVKANDHSGQVFACQQFTWLFSTAFFATGSPAAA